ncbi:MAG: ABC transporter permease [Ruminococcus sp.]|nr:ABC transporter permease [Ruminococcus sp.]
MNTVLGFTFLQQIRSKTYIITTVIIALILAALSAGALFISEMFIGKEAPTDIDYVYVSDSSVLSGIDYNVMHSSENELYKDIVFVNSQGDIHEAVKEASERSGHAVAIEVTDDEKTGFNIKVVKPEGFLGEKKSPDNLADFIDENLHYVIYEKSSLTDVQKTELLKNISIKMSVIGEEGASEDEEMIKNIIPAFFGVFLYMLLCIYGQNISRCVVLEKDSKMMEMMLVATKPYSLIFGKIFGIYFAALLQLAVWIISLAAGIGAGMSMTESVSGEILRFLEGFIENGGFSFVASVLSIAALLIGFLLYVSLAAFVGTFASKTEEVNSYYGIYTMIVVFSWMIPYINGLNGNDHVLGIIRFIPFTAPFTVPADILLGNINTLYGCISILLMLVSTSIIVFIAAKIYKAFVLYRGNPPKFKDVIRTLKKES